MFVEIDPAGTRKSPAMIGGRMVDTEMRWWHETTQGNRIRATRQAMGLGLRQAAKIIGINAYQLSSLEWGRCVYRKAADFDAAIKALLASNEV